MPISGWFGCALACCLLAAPARADLQRAHSEPNLEKRAQLALENAAAAYKGIRTAYEKGEMDQVAAAAKELQESVDLVYTSLIKTGKDPRKSPKWFKKAEIETRDLLRRLESFQLEMSFSDRPVLDAAKARIVQVHDDLLVGLMEGRRK